MTLGQKMRLVRSSRKMSQQRLGELASTHQKNISKYEQDLVIPSALTLKAIADSLEVTTDYLLGGEDAITVKDTALLKQFQEIDKMPEAARTALVSVIDAYVRDYRTRQAYS